MTIIEQLKSLRGKKIIFKRKARPKKPDGAVYVGDLKMVSDKKGKIMVDYLIGSRGSGRKFLEGKRHRYFSIDSIERVREWTLNKG